MIYIEYSFFIVLLCYYGDPKRGGRLFLRLLPLILFIVLVGFRSSSVGVDSNNYRYLYDTIPMQDYQWIEIGFDWLIRILDRLGFEYNGLFLVCITMTSISIFLTLEKTKYYFISAVFLYILTLTTVTNGIRQCISVGFFFYGATFIIEKKIIPFAICMTGALLFHYSSVILLPLYFILDKRFSNKTYAAIYLTSFVFIFVDIISIIKPLSYLMSGLGRNYYENFETYIRGDLSVLGFIYNTTINVAIFYLIMKANAFKKYPVLANSSLIVFVLKNMSMHMPIVGRVSLYFAWFPYLLLPYLIYDVFGRRNAPLIFFLAFIIYLIGFVDQLFGTEMKMIPYEFNFRLWR